MNTMDNTPTVLVPVKGSDMSESMGDTDQACKFCGGDEGLFFVAVMEEDETVEEVPEDRFLLVCEAHYTALLKSREYEIRELPPSIELGHDTREEIEKESVTILEEGNENRWLQASLNHETDLRDRT